MSLQAVCWAKIILVLVVIFGGCRDNDSKIQFDQEQLARQLADVRAGRTRRISFYESSDTDGLLESLRGIEGIEELRLNLTDASDDGMRHVATLPDLKKLTLYGGRGVGDRGLAYLKPLNNLHTLKLINTQVTDEGLAVLEDLPQLRSLTLYREAWRQPNFTDASFKHLEPLNKLQSLELSGGWASKDLMQNVRKALPDCSISEGLSDGVL